MKRALIITIDAARARLCLYQEQAKPGFELTEYRDLDNPGRRMKPGDMFSDSGPGSTFDDHRLAHIDEMDTKFAKHVLETLDAVLHEKQMAHLVLVASPRMLGVLRAEGRRTFERAGLHCDELARDLSGMSLPQLHDQLAGMGFIPPRARLAMAR